MYGFREEALLQLNDGDNEDDDYCWITKMQNKMKESIVDSSKMATIQYGKSIPTNIKSKS